MNKREKNKEKLKKKLDSKKGKKSHSSLVDKYMSDFGRKLLMTLIGILVAYAIVYLGTLVRNNVKEYNYIGQQDQATRTISIQGTGKVEATPNVATTNIGMAATATTSQAAIDEVNTVMNDLISRLKDAGVESKDIQTQDYSVREDYDYTEEGRELLGYRATQSVRVKIRDLNNSNKILSLASEAGANNVGGLQFDIEDPEDLKQQAREKAIKNAKQKAKKLSDSLGVRVVDVISYNESFPSGPVHYTEKATMGRGGDAAVEPTIEPGSQEVQVNVNITYQIR